MLAVFQRSGLPICKALQGWIGNAVIIKGRRSHNAEWSWRS